MTGGMQRAAVDMDTVAEVGRGGPTYTADETHFVEALRAGDELAFVALIDRYQPGMLRLARVFVRDVSVVEEVVQEAWLAVLRGLHRFEARSSPQVVDFEHSGQRREDEGNARATQHPLLSGLGSWRGII